MCLGRLRSADLSSISWLLRWPRCEGALEGGDRRDDGAERVGQVDATIRAVNVEAFMVWSPYRTNVMSSPSARRRRALGRRASTGSSRCVPAPSGGITS